MPLIDVQNVSFAYPGNPRPAVDRASLSIDSGEYLAVVGLNGSGKSTLLRLLDGLLTPDSGRVLIDGIEASDRGRARDVRSRIALVFQSPFDQLVSTVAEEDVAFGPENLGLPREEIGRRVEDALRAVGLLAERKRPCVFLSAGQQQRLALAGALAMRPDCIAFDEATSMLDPAAREDVLDLMDVLVSAGTAVVHVTHDMDEAARASRIIVLDSGRVAFDGSPRELFLGDAGPSRSYLLGLPRCAKAALALGLEPRLREVAAALAGRILEAAGGLASARAALSRARAVEDNAAADLPAALAAAAAAAPAPAPRPAIAASTPAFVLEAASHSYLRGTADESRGATDLTMSLPKGALVALIGRTGAGKSTALQLLNGLASADRGRVLAFGEDLSARSTDLRRVRMRSPLSIQRPESALFETYAGDDVAFGPRNQGLGGSALVERVRASMAETGLDYAGFRDRRVRGLSGGEKRKLALAGVLALDPDALLLDEPGSALDPSSRAAALDLIRARAGGDRAAVMATHDMEAAARADLVAVLSGGELVAFGQPATIFSGELLAEWGISPPFACEIARELASAGLELDPIPLDEESLARALAPAIPSARASDANPGGAS